MKQEMVGVKSSDHLLGASGVPGMVFYPYKKSDDNIDFDSLEQQEAAEDFRAKELQEKYRHAKQTSREHIMDTDEAQVVPEYYFDLTKGEGHKQVKKEHKRVKTRGDRSLGQTISHALK